jgi:hypothetical protein
MGGMSENRTAVTVFGPAVDLRRVANFVQKTAYWLHPAGHRGGSDQLRRPWVSLCILRNKACFPCGEMVAATPEWQVVDLQ